METKEQYLLEAKNLSKYFPVKNFFGNFSCQNERRFLRRTVPSVIRLNAVVYKHFGSHNTQ